MYVNAGKLNKRVEIVRRAYPIRNGRQTVEETPLRCCWAQVSHQSGSKVAAQNALSSEDVADVSTRFLIRAARHIPLGRLDTVRYAGDDYDIQYVNDYGERHEYTEILATHNFFRTNFLSGRLCTIYNVDNLSESAARVKHITKTVELLAGEREAAASGYYAAGRTAQLQRRTVRILRTEALSTAQLCEVDGQLYRIGNIAQTVDPSGLLVTDLTLEDAGSNWRERYVAAAD